MLKNFFLENDFFVILILILLVVFSLFSAEFFDKKNDKKQEILRKIPHILIGVLFSLSPIFMTKNEIIIAAVILFFGVWIGKYSKLFKNIFSIKRITYGMWITPFSLGIMSWIWLPENKIPFIVGMLILGFSDALAAIIGKYFGRKKMPFFKKTFSGSSAFFISSFLILWIFSENFKAWNLIWISSLLTLAEIIFIFGLDNFFLPLISSYLFYWFLM